MKRSGVRIRGPTTMCIVHFTSLRHRPFWNTSVQHSVLREGPPPPSVKCVRRVAVCNVSSRYETILDDDVPWYAHSGKHGKTRRRRWQGNALASRGHDLQRCRRGGVIRGAGVACEAVLRIAPILSRLVTPSIILGGSGGYAARTPRAVRFKKGGAKVS